MARIKHTERPATFRLLHTVALNFNEGNRDCAVKAVALACDVSYETAHATMKRLGRKDNCGTPVSIITQAVRDLGFTITKWTYVQRTGMIRQYPGAHKNLHNITTHHPRRFRQVWAQHDDKTLMFLTPRHVACFKGGIVHDWSVNNALQVIDVFQVEKA